MNPSIPSSSRFLGLPAELRIKIYRDLLISEIGQRKPIYTAEKTPDFARYSDMAILATCKLINQEALPIFYRHNNFVFTLTQPNARPRYEQAIEFWIGPIFSRESEESKSEPYIDTFSSHPPTLRYSSLIRHVTLSYGVAHEPDAIDLKLDEAIASQLHQIAHTCPSLIDLTINLLSLETTSRSPPDNSQLKALSGTTKALMKLAKRFKILKIVYFGTSVAFDELLHGIAPATEWTEEVYRGSTDDCDDAYFRWPGDILLSPEQISCMQWKNGLGFLTVEGQRYEMMRRRLSDTKIATGRFVFEEEIRVFTLNVRVS